MRACLRSSVQLRELLYGKGCCSVWDDALLYNTGAMDNIMALILSAIASLAASEDAAARSHCASLLVPHNFGSTHDDSASRFTTVQASSRASSRTTTPSACAPSRRSRTRRRPAALPPQWDGWPYKETSDDEECGENVSAWRDSGADELLSLSENDSDGDDADGNDSDGGEGGDGGSGDGAVTKEPLPEVEDEKNQIYDVGEFTTRSTSGCSSTRTVIRT
jgi:hypothetical protein